MDRELDYRAAVIVGWILYLPGEDHEWWDSPLWEHPDRTARLREDVPCYGDHIEAAMGLFDWMAERGLIRLCNGDGDSKDCDFSPMADSVWHGTTLQNAHVSRDTWAKAIRAAFLVTNGQWPDAAAREQGGEEE